MPDIQPDSRPRLKQKVSQPDPVAQNVNRHGFRWRLGAETGWTFLNEARFRWNHHVLTRAL
jgi:hypothetical protein